MHERQLRAILKNRPNDVAALNLLAVMLMKERRFAEAEPFIAKAARLTTSDATHHNYGLLLNELNRPQEALEQFDQALRLNPTVADNWYGRARSLADLKRFGEALDAFNRVLAQKPESALSWLGRGNVCAELGRPDDALAAYDRALALNPKLADAWFGRGNLCTQRKQYDEALIAFDKAFALDPGMVGAAGARLFSKMLLCEWRNFDTECNDLTASVRNGRANPPFGFLAINASPCDQRACASAWTNAKYPSAKPMWNGRIYNHGRIRLAYVSADFREHATAFLAAGLFECHDRSQFELTAISIGPADDSPMRQRLTKAFDHFIETRSLSDTDIAKWICAAEIDILVDLKGSTQHARTGIFAHRPAPIQVNYLGFPGTMGADYFDYLIADHTLVPPQDRASYREKIVYLPNSYQVNDAKRVIADTKLTRAEAGLPPHGFVFCCFNNNYKITPALFASWMRILAQVDHSVMWLFADNVAATRNLTEAAVAQGITGRLIFAKQMPHDQHLARHRLADLFLDTLPCNAHTTASDALWAGLPVLTQIGTTFAGRVAASLLVAIGLPELITNKAAEYEARAVQLATQGDMLAAIQRKLANNRLTAPLFDTALFTRHIEAAYRAMCERHRGGLAPDHIDVKSQL